MLTEHRSSRGPVQIHLPDHIELLPQLLKKLGDFTFNAGKTDYNFQWNQEKSIRCSGTGTRCSMVGNQESSAFLWSDSNRRRKEYG